MRTVRQVVGIVHIDKNTTVAAEQNTIASALLDALKDATGAQDIASSSDAIDPTLRRWGATTETMNALKGHVHDSLMVAIERDIAADKQSLEDAGFVFGPPDAMDVS